MTPFKVTALAAAVSTIVATGVAPAQEVEEEVGDRQVEEIIVTGSRIKRRDFNSPSPITSINRESLEASSQATMEALLNTMPQVAPNFGRASNNPGDGKAHVDLRGVGPGRTLVMLNARRFAPSGTGNDVDLNNIPRALIDRIEVITGGASTVYGSDALAGVVNFITRDDFEGISIEGNYGLTEEGDAAASDINIAWGTDFRDGRGNVAVFAGYHDREELFASERKLTSVTWQNDPETGELFEGGSFRAPAGAIFAPQHDFGNGPDFVTFNPDGTPRPLDQLADRYNFQEVNYLQTPLERKSAGILGRYEMDNGLEWYLESMFVANTSGAELAPVPAGGFFTFSIDNPLFTPETVSMLQTSYEVAPGTAQAFIAKRVNEVGQREIDLETEYWRTAIGLRGTIGGSWDFDAWATYTTNEEDEFQRNDVSASRLAQAMLVDPQTGQCLDPSGGCVPISLFGEGSITPEAADFVRVPAAQNVTDREQYLAAVVFTGTLFEMPAGPVDVATGIEWRRDEVSFEADPILFTGDTIGYRGDAPVDGTESVTELYAEAILPLYEDVGGAARLELELGGRYSKYDNAGGVETYKTGLNWQLNNSLRIRAMHQYAVRAPNNLELFKAQFVETESFVFDPEDDPCSASQDPIGNGIEEKCILQGLPADQVGVFEATPGLPIDITRGGNPDLRPEAADTLTVGLVITPESLPNWNFAIDYFDLDIEDGIGDINAYNICFDVKNTSNLFCDKIQRGPTGDFESAEELFNNRGLFSTHGIDTQINYSGDAPSFVGGDRGNQFGINILYTRTMSYKNQENPVSSVLEGIGYFGTPFGNVGGTAPKHRVSADFNYSTDRLGIILSTKWISGTDNWQKVDYKYFGGDRPLLAVPSIDEQFYADLYIRYDISDDIAVGFGIANLFDSDAPLIPFSNTGNNTDTGLYDVFGRSYRVSFVYRVGGN
ncbi:MAG: TonB-dependent receptor [Woeseiaceae bacterium]|jgi:iron complex outermembrane receptor protein